MGNRKLALVWFLLLPLLPACSLIPAPQQSLEGLPSSTLQEVRQQSAELERLQKLDASTPARQRQIDQLRSSLRQFERDAIRTAKRLENQGEWHDAGQILQAATDALPNSQALGAARQQFSERRQSREERVRMELAIQRGEQLLQEADAYQRLRQLKGPDVLTWLELKNFHRKCRGSAQELQVQAQQAVQRQDYSAAQRALKIARRLYGNDLLQDRGQREAVDQALAQFNHKLRQTQQQTAKVDLKKDDKAPVTELQQALETGDLLSARQHLNQLEQHSPKNPQLQPLQSQFRIQLNARVEAAIKLGNDLYSEGKIERAVEVWREAKALDPDNVELLTNIARAEKVLENLKVLSGQPGSPPQE
ncbi:tetratricopeptide repeat protein [Microbulbifer guangxiensis]|uniref:tetratricopeptide repeat protein n=1 Tax=Microbulbifer guangxiensis TaxID=2904249 RepID=UPI001F32C5FD|nr:tetratricopeptide repeat protein [Microbulbifer guangxiensis]